MEKKIEKVIEENMGRSVKLELGYAIAKKKPIYLNLLMI